MCDGVAAVYFTRATSRRILGALAGGATVGWMGLGVIAWGQALGLWRVPVPSTPFFLTLFYLGFAISVSPIYLITWPVGTKSNGRVPILLAQSARGVGTFTFTRRG
jgi:hypothetical protein